MVPIWPLPASDGDGRLEKGCFRDFGTGTVRRPWSSALLALSLAGTPLPAGTQPVESLSLESLKAFETSFEIPGWVSAYALARIRPQQGDEIVVHLTPLYNQFWNTPFRYTWGGARVLVTGYIQRNNKDGLCGVFAEGWEEPKWFNIRKLYDNRKNPPVIEVGAERLQVYLRAGLFISKRIVFQPLSDPETRYEIKLQRLLDEIHKSGFEVRLRRGTYHLFYGNEPQETVDGKTPQGKLIIALLTKDSNDDGVIWVKEVEALPAEGALRVELYWGDVVEIRLDPAANILKIQIVK